MEIRILQMLEGARAAKGIAVVIDVFRALMLVYWTAIFSVISIGNAVMLEGEFSNHFFLYPIFLMPSFVLVLLLLALVAMGM